jgi:hypothetical protein
MKIKQRENVIDTDSLQNLGRTALDAAAELDRRIGNPRASNRHIISLANQIKVLFPGAGRPLLPSEAIGLVCDVIEDWKDVDQRTSDFEEPNRIAQEIAKKLEQPKLPKNETERLIHFCLALHNVTRSTPAMHDIPDDHPYVLTFA